MDTCFAADGCPATLLADVDPCWELSGLFGFFLCDICWYKSLLLIGPRLTLLIQSLTPPMAAVMSWLCINDRLGPWQWAAMGVTLAGVAWVVLEQPDGNGLSHPTEHRRRGIALAVFAAATQAIGLVFSKEGMRGYDDAVAATLIRGLVALPGFICAYHANATLARHVCRHARRPRHDCARRGSRLGGVRRRRHVHGALRHAPTGVVATIVATMPVLILPCSIFVYHENIIRRGRRGHFCRGGRRNVGDIMLSPIVSATSPTT